jgi:cation:H+ antiporter
VYADVISEKSGFSAGLMGITLLAVITSFPELVTSLTSVTVINAPNLATGDLVGAVAINIFWIALLGICCRKGTLFANQNKSNVFTALITIIMLLVVIISIGVRKFNIASPRLFSISLGSYIIGFLYIAGSAVVYKFETHNVRSKRYNGLARDMLRLSIAGAVIIGSGIWLAYIGKDIAGFYGLNELYVGMLLLAFATTMPEFVVSLTAWRRGSTSMAIGNFLGSNFFNIFIILWLDAAMRKENLFFSLSNFNVHLALFAIVLTVIAVLAMVQKRQKRELVQRVSWDSLFIIVTFVVGHLLFCYVTCKA